MLKTSPAWLVVCLMLCYIYLNTPSSNLKQNLSMMTWLQSSIREGEVCKPEVKPAVTVQIISDPPPLSRQTTSNQSPLKFWKLSCCCLYSNDIHESLVSTQWIPFQRIAPHIETTLVRVILSTEYLQNSDLITEMSQKGRKESGLSHGWVCRVVVCFSVGCSSLFSDFPDGKFCSDKMTRCSGDWPDTAGNQSRTWL